MNSRRQRSNKQLRARTIFLAVVAIPIWAASAAEELDALERTQTIQLKAGWNAAFLEVEPAVTQPEKLFEGTPVDIVAGWFPRTTSVEYISDPDARPWNQDGWGVWYAPARPDAFLKTLHAVHSNRAYLIHTPEDYEWQVAGAANTAQAIWKAGSYNFVGFGLDRNAPPTFKEFFAPSKAHQPLKAYRLEDGKWKLITAPETARMRDGEAYWVYCKRGSDYQGPVEVKTRFQGRILLQSAAATGEITVKNHTAATVDVQILDASSGERALPLASVMRALNETTSTVTKLSTDLPALSDLPPLAAGSSLSYRVAAKTQEMTAPIQLALLEIRTSLGTRVWLPVVGHRQDLEEDE